MENCRNSQAQRGQQQADHCLHTLASIPVPILSNLIISNLHVGTMCMLGKFINGKNWEEWLIPEVYAAVQRQLDRLESWAERNLKQLIKANAMSFTWEELSQVPLLLGGQPAGKQLCYALLSLLREGHGCSSEQQVEYESAMHPNKKGSQRCLDCRRKSPAAHPGRWSYPSIQS